MRACWQKMCSLWSRGQYLVRREGHLIPPENMLSRPVAFLACVLLFAGAARAEGPEESLPGVVSSI